MNDKTHITNAELYAFQHDFMNQKEKEDFLEHICSCDYCSDQFATMMSEEIIEAPKDMKTNILKASRRPEVQLAIRVKATSKRMQLFMYSLKVGTATALALLLLLLTVNFNNFNVSANSPDNITTEQPNNNKHIPLTAVFRDNLNKVGNSILNFSNNIMNTEVTDHD